MKKSIVLGITLVCGLVLAGCGNSQNSKENSASSQSEKVVSSSSSSSINSVSSSSSSKSEEANTPATSVNNKQAGVMLALLVNPDWFKEYIGNAMSYDQNSNFSDEVKGYSCITANGDPTSYLYYKVDGDTVNYKQWVPGDSVADGHFESNSVSLTRLENDYYVNQNQKDEVNQYVNELK